MKNVPHWQWLVLMYFFLVAIPVYLVHNYFKQKAYANRTFKNLIIYFITVLGSGFVLHSICMWLYFTFFFGLRN